MVPGHAPLLLAPLLAATVSTGTVSTGALPSGAAATVWARGSHQRGRLCHNEGVCHLTFSVVSNIFFFICFFFK